MNARSRLSLWQLAVFGAAIACGRVQAQDASESAQVASPAGGEVEQAGAHFERGVEYYEDGDYPAALLEFQRAYSLQHAYQLLYNLGQVANELRDYASAEDYFHRYLQSGKDAIAADRRSEVNAELTRLKARIGSLRISCNLTGAEIRIDERRVEHPENGPVRVSAGRRQVVADKPGYVSVERAVDVLGGEERSVALVFGPPIGQTQPTAAVAEPSHVLPWVTGIGSAVLLVGAGTVGYLAYRDASDYRSELDRYTSQGELDRLSSNAHSKALVADILLGAAIASAAATVILLVTGDSSASEATNANAKNASKLGLQLKLAASGASGAQLQF